MLDKDGDGEISSEELKEAIVKIIKRASSLKEAEELILTLDSNNDGRGEYFILTVNCILSDFFHLIKFHLRSCWRILRRNLIQRRWKPLK